MKIVKGDILVVIDLLVVDNSWKVGMIFKVNTVNKYHVQIQTKEGSVGLYHKFFRKASRLESLAFKYHNCTNINQISLNIPVLESLSFVVDIRQGDIKDTDRFYAYKQICVELGIPIVLDSAGRYRYFGLIAGVSYGWKEMPDLSAGIEFSSLVSFVDHIFADGWVTITSETSTPVKQTLGDESNYAVELPTNLSTAELDLLLITLKRQGLKEIFRFSDNSYRIYNKIDNPYIIIHHSTYTLDNNEQSHLENTSIELKTFLSRYYLTLGINNKNSEEKKKVIFPNEGYCMNKSQMLIDRVVEHITDKYGEPGSRELESKHKGIVWKGPNYYFIVSLSNKKLYTWDYLKQFIDLDKYKIETIRDEPNQEAICRFCEENILECHSSTSTFQCEGTRCAEASEKYYEEFEENKINNNPLKTKKNGQIISISVRKRITKTGQICGKGLRNPKRAEQITISRRSTGNSQESFSSGAKIESSVVRGRAFKPKNSRLRR